MRVFVVYECLIVEHEESFRIMSVHSSFDGAEEAIAEYEAVAKKWRRGKAVYMIDECELDASYYGWTEVR